MKPILKWAGGKGTLIPHILKLFPLNYRSLTYHEPFFGGGALFFKVRPQSGSINDINTKLMNFYLNVRDNPKELISQAQEYHYDKETYYTLRDRFNQPHTPELEQAALFLYLNKTAFNGLYRVNSKGDFNVPFGRYKNPTIIPKKTILTVSKILKKVDIRNEDFSYIVDYAKKGDLCYFDPPYQPVSETANFTSYSIKGFSLAEQRRLRDVCSTLSTKGVYWVLSNSFADPIRELYQDINNIRMTVIQALRSISSKPSTRGATNEILITNIPEQQKTV